MRAAQRDFNQRRSGPFLRLHLRAQVHFTGTINQARYAEERAASITADTRREMPAAGNQNLSFAKPPAEPTPHIPRLVEILGRKGRCYTADRAGIPITDKVSKREMEDHRVSFLDQKELSTSPRCVGSSVFSLQNI